MGITMSNSDARSSAPDSVERRGEHLLVTRTLLVPVALAERAIHAQVYELMALAAGVERPNEDGTLDVRLATGARMPGIRANLEFLTPRHSSGGTRVHLTWRARSLPGLFPIMQAELSVKAAPTGHAVLILDGTYCPPLGILGLLADRVLGMRVALATAEQLLAALADAVEASAWRLAPSAR